MFFKKKEICKNCGLFNHKAKRCKVNIMHEGKIINIPVDPKDPCFFNDTFVAIEDGKEVEFTPEVEKVRMWVEDPITRQPTDKEGIVKIEYPEGFFGDDAFGSNFLQMSDYELEVRQEMMRKNSEIAPKKSSP